MTFLGTLLRGLRARALLTVGSVLLTAIGIGAAMLGPIFTDAASSSYAVSRLEGAPALSTGLSFELRPAAELADDPEEAVRRAVHRVARLDGPSFGAPRAQLQTERFAALGGEAQLVARPGACAHLVVRGRCPGAAGEAMLLDIDADYLGLAPGDRLHLGGGLPGGPDTLVVVGAYRLRPGEDDFWFDRARWTSHAKRSDAPTPYRPAPVVVAPATFAALPAGSWSVQLDSRLRVRPDHAVADLAAARDRVRAADAERDVPGGVLVPAPSNAINDLAGVAAEVHRQQADARRSITPATVSLVLVALVLLLRLLVAAAELRLPELAIASLRGTATGRLWLLGMAEPLAVIAIALGPGLVLGYGIAAALVRAWLVPGLPVPVPVTALAAAAAVVVASAGVAALAVQRVVRAPLAEQLSGVRRPGRVARVVLIGFLTAVAACVALVAGALAGATSRKPDLGDFLLPVLLAAVAGVAATWLVGWLARRYAARPAGNRSIAGFVASRAVSRRQEGTLVVLPLTAALAIGTFAIGVDHAAASWRQSAAATRAPAAQVWSSPLGLDETVALTHRLDPDGQWLMAAAASTYPEGLVSVVDAERLARVSAWPDGWVDGKDAHAVQELIAPSVGVPRFAGPVLSLSAENQLDTDGDVYLHLLLEDGRGPLSADAGPFPVGTSTQRVALPSCRQGCRLRTVTIGRGAGLPLSMHGRFTLREVAVAGSPARSATTLGLRPGHRSGSVVALHPAAGGVAVDLDTRDGGGTALLGTGGVSALAPALVGANAQWHTTRLGRDGRRLILPDGPLDVLPVARADSLPFFGPAGVLVDYSAFAATHTGQFGQLSDVSVLARGDTPAQVTDRLHGADLTVGTTLAAERTALDDSAYALALRLYGVSAVLVLLMALAGLVFSTVVQLPARRRDAAALRVVGVRRRQVLGAVARELLVVLGTAAVAGVVAGLLAQLVVLRTLTLGYATELSTPAPSAAVDPLRLVTLVALTSVALGVVAVLSAAASVRGARAATLRESTR